MLRRQRGVLSMRQLLCLLLILQGMPVLATTVYKSVDSSGHISFSDQPPISGTLVEIREYKDPAPVSSAVDTARLQAMREVTDRMAADRREREAARLAARRLKYEQQVAQEPYYDYPYYGGYTGSYHRRNRPGIRPPGVRPPGIRPPGMRPPVHPRRPIGGPAILSQYPAKLVRRHYTGAARRVFNPTRSDFFSR